MIEMVRPGQCVTVQDCGRVGFRSEGVPESGALARGALELANWLVGNSGHEAALEIYGGGPMIRFSTSVIAAVIGEHQVITSGGAHLIPYRPQWIEAGETLHLSFPVRGMTSYLAIHGGIQVDPVLGSRSTDTANGLGGFCGRPLQTGDQIPVSVGRTGQPRALGSWERVRLSPLRASGAAALRIVKGPDADMYNTVYQQLLSSDFTVSPNSNRVALRVSNKLKADGSPLATRLSEGTVPGTIQLLPDGDILIHLADGPVSGGYPVLGIVATADLAQVAQLRPGTAFTLREVTIAEAHRSKAVQRASQQLAKYAIQWCYRRGLS